MVNNVDLAMDASGGTATITVELDPQFECLIQVITLQVIGPASNVDFRMNVSRNGGGNIIVVGSAFKPSFDSSAYASWNPSAIIDPANFNIRSGNVTGDSLRMNAMIYNFQKRASEKVPLDQLLASLPRGSSTNQQTV